MTEAVRVVGAGLPRTGTSSLKMALERLLGGRCSHMSEIEGHPFDLGAPWEAALAGRPVRWKEALTGYVAFLDWPASMFWRELAGSHPDALVLLSTRDAPETWWQSLEATVLPFARRSAGPDWEEGRDLAALFELFAGTPRWDERDVLLSAYERHNAQVRLAAAPERLVEWHPGDGWGPLCRALGLPVPAEPFPWVNKRGDW